MKVYLIISPLFSREKAYESENTVRHRAMAGRTPALAARWIIRPNEDFLNK